MEGAPKLDPEPRHKQIILKNNTQTMKVKVEHSVPRQEQRCAG